MAYAKVMGKASEEEFRQQVRLTHLNAKLVRAEKIPDIDKLLAPQRKPRLSEIVANLESKPTFKQE